MKKSKAKFGIFILFRVYGYIKNYKRRFWQGSNDHRGIIKMILYNIYVGTPENPGRVVTLIPIKEYLALTGTIENNDISSGKSIIDLYLFN